MSVKELEAFLARKEREDREWGHPDREAVKAEWLGYVRQFYDRVINEWLAALIAAGKVAYEFQPMTLNEKQLGPYQVESLILELVGCKIALKPIGRFILGAMGRIDMENIDGVGSYITFVLVDKLAATKAAAGKVHQVNINGNSTIKDSNTSDRDLKADRLAWKILTPASTSELIDLNADTFSDALLGVLDE